MARPALGAPSRPAALVSASHCPLLANSAVSMISPTHFFFWSFANLKVKSADSFTLVYFHSAVHHISKCAHQSQCSSSKHVEQTWGRSSTRRKELSARRCVARSCSSAKGNLLYQPRLRVCRLPGCQVARKPMRSLGSPGCNLASAESAQVTALFDYPGREPRRLHPRLRALPQPGGRDTRERTVALIMCKVASASGLRFSLAGITRGRLAAKRAREIGLRAQLGTRRVGRPN